MRHPLRMAFMGRPLRGHQLPQKRNGETTIPGRFQSRVSSDPKGQSITIRSAMQGTLAAGNKLRSVRVEPRTLGRDAASLRQRQDAPVKAAKMIEPA
jgi:hypothetical protein